MTSRDTRIVASDAGGAGFFFFVEPPPKIRKPASAFGVSESFVSDVNSATSRPKAFAPALFRAPEKRAIRPKASTRGFVFVSVSVSVFASLRVWSDAVPRAASLKSRRDPRTSSATATEAPVDAPTSVKATTYPLFRPSRPS